MKASERLRKVSQNLELTNIWNYNSNYQCNLFPTMIDPTQSTIFQNYVKTEWSMKDSSDVFCVFIGLEVYAEVDKGYLEKINVENLPNKKAFEINTTLVLVYRVKDINIKFEDIDYDIFSKANGVYTAHPYMRANIQDICSKMGVPAVMLPLFKPVTIGALNKMFEEKNENEEAKEE